MAKPINNSKAPKYSEENARPRYLKFGDRVNEMTDTLETTRQFLDRTGYNYINWCASKRQEKTQKKKYYHPVDFLLEYTLLYDAWDYWQKHDDKFKELIAMGNEILGAHREAGVAEREFDSSILKNQRYYSRITATVEKQVNEEKKLSPDHGDTVKYVFSEKDPESELVTEKLKVKDEVDQA